ncbi:HRDC domain-containing protein [Corynebacterium alimapuense]|uniref:Ribonuclease D n=1 Tax=Corynebacterium alimapuense TaxID=1576874 RepID=A0A3M8K922_9CORY|nr:ribonuclease D [Corynebacterium alimapuense]RNE49285.1 ribonuclease D [Corynebacterium alimapuense]
MCSVLSSPSGVVPPLIDSPAGFSQAAEALAAGQGPVAIDTERASGFRYDDRAFLIQIRRRGVGTLLLDPEGHRDEFTKALAPVLNGLDWVIHAAISDLPCLAWLGLYPGRLFDTEVAGRLAGFDHVNLAAMTEAIFEVTLRKGHGAEDWSRRPLPADWLDYAALDVELLLELAEAMAELLDSQGKLEWADEEFEHIKASYAGMSGPPVATWRAAKGVSSLIRPEQLAIARELWLARESIAVDNDQAVSKVLPNRVLVEVARAVPRTPKKISQVKGFPARRKGATNFWFGVVNRALTSDSTTWPQRQRGPRSLPSRQPWSRDYPDSWSALEQARELIEQLSIDLDIPVENILRPAVLRIAAWQAAQERTVRTSDELAELLHDHDARAWQIELTVPLIAPVLLA